MTRETEEAMLEDHEIARAEGLADSRRDVEPILLEDSKVYPVIVDQLAKVLGPTHKEGGLDQTQRILVALGMAVQSGSDSAIEWTMTRAMNHGASKEQIIDTLDVALLYGGGLAVAGVRFAYNTMRVRELRARRSPVA